ncbi:SNF2-related protein [Bacillus kwashiorkori]|uniref:SNF2-related protein n=1 Tax=Bacillus kwashiorkori TaxID=1522318 RepID=UPI000A830699|nr:SNF2-related protein [Bacillus kwashiorkori]
MLKIMQLTIRTKLNTDGSFFIFAVDDNGFGVPVGNWSHLLFQWHKQSFYGVKLDNQTELVTIGRSQFLMDGVRVDAFSALELFGTEPFNGLVHWEFDDFSQIMLAVAPVMYESIVDLKWRPNFTRSANRMTWEVPEDVWDEFLPNFWEEKLADEAFLQENVFATKQEFVQQLFDNGVHEFLKNHSVGGKNWTEQQAFLQSLVDRHIPVEKLFSDEMFMEWIGLKEDELPFSVGYRLEEPEEDGDWWTLETILRDKKKQEVVIPYTSRFDDNAGSRKGRTRGAKIPKRWEPFLDTVEERLQRVKELFFDGEWKYELTEDEAWGFLTNTSEALLMLGFEILLPAWWESIKEANLRLKAQVSSGSSGPSFVGLDAIMDFEWRLSINDVDFSEAEFQKLVEQNRRLIYVNGQWVKLDPDFIRQIKSMMEKAEKKGMRVQDFIEQELLYGADEREAFENDDHNAEVFSRIQIELHPKLRSFVQSLTELTELPNEPVPQALHGELRPYQVKGMNWLYFLRKYRFGACLADDMGLGKTIQLIAYLLLVKEREPMGGPALIICPTSVLGNWQREMEKFAPDLRVHLHYGPSRKKADEFRRVVGFQDDGNRMGRLDGGDYNDGVGGMDGADYYDGVGGLDGADYGDGVGRLDGGDYRGSSESAGVEDYRDGSGDLDDADYGDGVGWLDGGDYRGSSGNPRMKVYRDSVDSSPVLSEKAAVKSNVVSSDVSEDGMEENAGHLVNASGSGSEVLFEKERASLDQADVVLTTYGLAHIDFDELASVSWGTIVLDEAQNIKNAATKQSRAIRKLKGQHHIALTGTPMENRLTELWSIFDFINKGYLGSLTHFQQRFVLPIERERDTVKIDELRKLIRPFLLRRTKLDEEVALNLPEKLEQKEYCPLTPEQAALYDELVQTTFEQITKLSGFERKGLVLKLLGKLKQLCNHPALYLKETGHQYLLERSTKLEKLAELFDSILDQEEHGLIFTQYLGMGEMIRFTLEKRYKIKIPFLNGGSTKQQRDEMIDRFQNGEYPILLLSLKAGGTGLNLTAANHVVHYDRWWNPAVENQATDRAYRIGQTKFVHVHKFITTGTLEEKIDAMLERKQSLNNEIIQSDQWLADMSDNDLYDILKLD